MFKVETEPQYQSSAADRLYRRMTGPQTADRKLGCNQYKGLCSKSFAAGIWGHKWLCCSVNCSAVLGTMHCKVVLQILMKAQDMSRLSLFCRWVGYNQTFQGLLQGCTEALQHNQD